MTDDHEIFILFIVYADLSVLKCNFLGFWKTPKLCGRAYKQFDFPTPPKIIYRNILIVMERLLCILLHIYHNFMNRTNSSGARD